VDSAASIPCSHAAGLDIRMSRNPAGPSLFLRNANFWKTTTVVMCNINYRESGIGGHNMKFRNFEEIK
jgi:hypothetical protein